MIYEQIRRTDRGFSAVTANGLRQQPAAHHSTGPFYTGPADYFCARCESYRRIQRPNRDGRSAHGYAHTGVYQHTSEYCHFD